MKKLFVSICFQLIAVSLILIFTTKNAIAAPGDFIDVFVSEGKGGLDLPKGIVFGPDGNFYVASDNTDQVLRYNSATGAFLDVFASGGGLDRPLGIVFGPDGNLYVASSNTDEVLRYDGATGAFIDIFASGGGLNTPDGIVFGPDGNLYVASSNTDEVLRYDGATGAFIDVFASGGGLRIVSGIIFGLDGNLYANSVIGDQVLRYDGATGAFIDVFASGGGLNAPQLAIAFGPDGNLYVGSVITNQVLRYNGATGDFIDVFISSGDGGLDGPEGIVFGSDGNLYVASADTDQVLRYSGTEYQNRPPVANAGSDMVVFDEATLDGNASYDPDGSIVAYEWSLQHEDGSIITVSGSNPTISELPSGFFDVHLAVTDNGGLVDTDLMILAAAGQCPISPVADEDEDGEPDITDICADTPPDTDVDSDGCSLWQFCTAIDTSSNYGRRICRKSDWKNNEPLKIKGDCKAVKQGKGQSNYSCVPL
jgi:streptogramin lyase